MQNQAYHHLTTHDDSALLEVHWMFSVKTDSSRFFKKTLNLLAVLLLKACHSKNLGFNYQQKISFGNYSRTEYGGFVGATRPTQNNIQELVSFLLHLVCSSPWSNCCSFPFIKDVQNSVSTLLLTKNLQATVHTPYTGSLLATSVSQKLHGSTFLRLSGLLCVCVCRFCTSKIFKSHDNTVKCWRKKRLKCQ